MLTRNGFRVLLLMFLVQAACICLSTPACGSDEWYVAFRGGVSSPDKFLDFFDLEARYEAENIVVLDAGWRFAKWKEMVDFCLEGQIAHHWGVQRYQEANMVLTARVHIFPESLPVPISLAAGSGLSYTSTIPIIETDTQKEKNYGSRSTSRLLHYLMVETAFGISKVPKVETFVRIHHRSGIFGLMSNDTGAGSNYLTGGIRFYF